MNFYKSLKLFVVLQMTTGCQNGQIPQFNSLEEAVQFAEENDIPLEDLPYRKWNRWREKCWWQLLNMGDNLSLTNASVFWLNFKRRHHHRLLLIRFCHQHSITIIKSPTSQLLASHLPASHLPASNLLASHVLASQLLAGHQLLASHLLMKIFLKYHMIVLGYFHDWVQNWPVVSLKLINRMQFRCLSS